jgi:Ni/Co efflux regulator RcnB
MRKFIISLLLAGVAVSPAMARPQDADQNEQRARPDRAEAREQFRAQRDAQRADNGSRPERPQFSGNRPDGPQFDGNRGDRPRFDGNRPSFDGQRPSPEQIQAYRQQRGDGTARWNRDNVQRSGETSHWTRQPDQRAGETQRWTRDRNGGWNRPGGEVNQDWQQRQAWQNRQPTVDGRRWTGTWNRDWRNDRRYDWRRYRDQHRSTFRLGIYFDPFGYNYRRYDIGYRLSPAYYGQKYWFDPAMYGLPYPPPGTQWIRYWNDALLVDIYSGQVIDAIPNFFW